VISLSQHGRGKTGDSFPFPYEGRASNDRGGRVSCGRFFKEAFEKSRTQCCIKKKIASLNRGGLIIGKEKKREEEKLSAINAKGSSYCGPRAKRSSLGNP